MITEYAEVVEVDATRIKVEIRSTSACGNCSAKSGCGTGVLDRWLNPSRLMWIDAEKHISETISVGDELQVGVDEGAFVRNAFSLYLIPILVFLIGAGLGYQIQGEFLSIAGGIFGLIGGAYMVRYLIKRSPYAEDFAPRIIESRGTTQVTS